VSARTYGHFSSHFPCVRSPRLCGISSGQPTGSDRPVRVYRYRSGNSFGSLVFAGTVDATDSLRIAVPLQLSVHNTGYKNRCYFKLVTLLVVTYVTLGRNVALGRAFSACTVKQWTV